MKKIFTLTILSLMAILTIVNSCSKSSDTTPATTPPVVFTADTNKVIIDPVATPINLNPVNCISNPANAIFTMTFLSDDGQTTVTATFLPKPAASGTYTIKVLPPSAATDIQLTLISNLTTYTATSGTATVTVVNGLVKVMFSKITFVHALTNKVVTATVVCI